MDVNARCVELDHKIIEARQGQPLVGSRIQELITLRCDTNAFLEAQSTFPPPSSERHLTEDILAVPEAEAPADTRHPVDSSPTEQVPKTTRLESRPIRGERAASIEMDIYGQQDYGSSEGDSSDDDSDYITGSRYTKHNECFQDLTFSGRPKAPCPGELSVIKLSDPAFDRLMNYWSYRLYLTTMIRSADDSRKLRERVKTFQATFKSTDFSAEDSIMVFKFFTEVRRKLTVSAFPKLMHSLSSSSY